MQNFLICFYLYLLKNIESEKSEEWHSGNIRAITPYFRKTDFNPYDLHDESPKGQESQIQSRLKMVRDDGEHLLVVGGVVGGDDTCRFGEA